jgi:two-component system chemotaxis response regulator CheB
MTSILLIDDSSFTKKVLRRMLQTHPDFQVIAEAANGSEGLSMIEKYKPDIVILDVEMPIMNGLELLKKVKSSPHRPRFLLFSAHTQRHAQITIECLLEGGSDYICKPQDDPTLQSLKQELFRKLIQLSTKNSTLRTPTQKYQARALPPKLICVATSTGGPDALKSLLKHLDRNFSIPILIVQHMPPLFTKLLSQTLSRQTQRTIKEAEETAQINNNDIIIAKGGTHLVIKKEGQQLIYESIQKPPVNGLRPCADLLFSSAAHTLRSRVMGIVLTGMGQDGTKGAIDIHEHGGSILIQDKQSSIVWGMPGSIARSKIPAQEKTLGELTHVLNRLALLQ